MKLTNLTQDVSKEAASRAAGALCAGFILILGSVLQIVVTRSFIRVATFTEEQLRTD